jgi:hypothetical protein
MTKTVAEEHVFDHAIILVKKMVIGEGSYGAGI